MKRVYQSVKLAMLVAVTALTWVGCSKQSTAEVKPDAPQTAQPAVKPYPLETCVVADEKLGSMGDPYVFVHEGQELKLCCKGCLKDFNKEPAKYLVKVEAVKKS